MAEARNPPADPFADAGIIDAKGKDAKDYVHVRVQQRNGKKCLTTVQGLPKKFDLDKILKALKKGESSDRLVSMCLVFRV